MNSFTEAVLVSFLSALNKFLFARVFPKAKAHRNSEKQPYLYV